MGAWVGAALTGLGMLGGLFGNKKTVSDQSYSNTSTPNYDPTNLNFRNYLIKNWSDMIGGAGSNEYQDAYTTAGLKNINTTQSRAAQSISDLLTSRGLGRTSAGVGTLGDVSLSGANQTANFLNSVPLIMDQRRQQILNSAGGYQASLPVGTNSSGSSHTVSTGPGGVPSSPAAGGIFGGATGLATYLGQLNAQNAFAKALKSLGPGSGNPGTNGGMT